MVNDRQLENREVVTATGELYTGPVYLNDLVRVKSGDGYVYHVFKAEVVLGDDDTWNCDDYTEAAEIKYGPGIEVVSVIGEEKCAEDDDEFYDIMRSYFPNGIGYGSVGENGEDVY